MGAETDDTIDALFEVLLQRSQQAIETSNNNGSGFTHKNVALLCCYFMKIDIRRAESYNESSDWLENKGATINPKNKKDNKSFHYAITSGLNYNKIKNKYLKQNRKN